MELPSPDLYALLAPSPVLPISFSRVGRGLTRGLRRPSAVARETNLRTVRPDSMDLGSSGSYAAGMFPRRADRRRGSVRHE